MAVTLPHATTAFETIASAGGGSRAWRRFALNPAALAGSLILLLMVSAGVAAWRSERTAEQVLEAADAMLYAAKRAGKDRVMVEAPVALEESGAGPA